MMMTMMMMMMVMVVMMMGPGELRLRFVFGYVLATPQPPPHHKPSGQLCPALSPSRVALEIRQVVMSSARLSVSQLDLTEECTTLCTTL